MVSYATLHEWKTSDDDILDSHTFEYGTRIAYLAVSGAPGSRLIDQVVPPYKAIGGFAPVAPLCPINPQVSAGCRHEVVSVRPIPLCIAFGVLNVL